MGIYIRTEEHKKKQAELKRGDINPHWFGNEVGYHGLHSWVRRNKIKPELCENCMKIKPYDMANISGEYKRDINDYKWLCRKCHMKEDGRMNNLKKSTLTQGQVAEVRLLLSQKIYHKDIAKKFNVGRSIITNINIGRSHKNKSENEVILLCH